MVLEPTSGIGHFLLSKEAECKTLHLEKQSNSRKVEKSLSHQTSRTYHRFLNGGVGYLGNGLFASTFLGIKFSLNLNVS